MTRWILPLALFASLNFGSASGGALNEGDSVSCSKKTADCTIDLVLTEVNTPDGCSVSVSMTIKCCETTCQRTRNRGCGNSVSISVKCAGKSIEVDPGNNTWGSVVGGVVGCDAVNVS